MGFCGGEETWSLGTPVLSSATFVHPLSDGGRRGICVGPGGWNVLWRIWILFVFPIQAPEGRGRGRGGMEVPPANPTITHTPGAAPGSWAGLVQVCGC